MSEKDCIFCRIVRGEMDAEVVHDEDEVLAFNDIRGLAPVHVLVIPKQHLADSVADLDLGDPGVAQTWANLLAVAQRVGSAPEFAGGWRLVTNVGQDGGQSVFHLHLHVLAGRRLAWPPG